MDPAIGMLRSIRGSSAACGPITSSICILIKSFKQVNNVATQSANHMNVQEPRESQVAVCIAYRLFTANVVVHPPPDSPIITIFLYPRIFVA